MLKAGFARGEITPPLGVSVQGYFEPRTAKGVLDPLLATAVAFDDGEKRAVVMSVDVIGMNMELMSLLRPAVAKAIDADVDGVFIASTHTHLGPGVASTEATVGKFENPEYGEWLITRIADIAALAVNDLAPVTQKLYTRGEVKNVSFIRRYRMKDGTVRTNPGWLNPDVDHALGTPDEESQLFIIKREGKPEIGIVNFQVHPDVIGGELLSADYPKFVRDTYELNVPNSLCMYINGAQGDSNHIDIRLDSEKECAAGYDRARYMGKKIAMSVISNYELAKELSGEKVAYAKKIITTKFNKGTPEEIPAALELAKRYHELGSEGALPDVHGMLRTEMIAKATRIEKMQTKPDNKELIVCAISVGDMVFASLPGEPFTEVGRQIKANSPFALTIPACCANGYEGYYPMQSAFDEGGYEALTSRYVAGTAEMLIAASSEIIKTLK
ncbi:MAG: hypothetical protein IJ299_00900 [Oscillospiraceae bacterium]|nr:hypothetical protein [Oscillospiraceae bacterium]